MRRTGRHISVGKMINTNIAHYKITAKLGEGGMGAVYRATDTKLGREVAIKVLPQAFAADPDRMARFTREAQVLASLNHPNIAAIYGVEDRALVMELVEGSDLSSPLPLETALDFARQLIDGLEYAHEKGVVHRDLKPANIKITPQGQVKILDFGLAKMTDPAHSGVSMHDSPTLTIRATEAGLIMGTAAYMAPEQARGQTVDKRADIWSFGVVLYEMLSGKQLFAGGTVSDILAHVLTRQIDLAAMPARVRPLLERCLTRDPRQRLRDIGDARILLDALATVVEKVTYSRRWPLPVAYCALAIAAAVIAGLLWRTPTPSRPILRQSFTQERFAEILLSPDGKYLLDNIGPLKIRPVDSAEWRILPDTEGAIQAFWSGDSSAIGFFSESRLKTIPIHGGVIHNLAAAPQPQGGAWRGGITGGSIVFASNGRLHLVDSGSGAEKELSLRFEESERALHPTFLPEGDGFGYLLRSSAGIAFYRFIPGSLRTAGEKQLDTDRIVRFSRHPRTGKWHVFFCGGARRRNSCELVTAPVNQRTGSIERDPMSLIADVIVWGGQNALYSVAHNGMIVWRPALGGVPVWRIHWLDLHGNVVGSVGEGKSFTGLRLSPDETRLATTQDYPTRHVWTYNLKTGAGSRVSSQPVDERFPVWSPDSRTLYYVGRTETDERIFRRSMDGGTQPELLLALPRPTETGRQVATEEVSSDGKYLLVSRSGMGVFRLDLTAADKARKLELILDFPIGGYAGLRMSPDGRWMLIGGDATNLAVPYPPLGAKPRPIGEISFPIFRSDGKALFGIRGNYLLSRPLIRDAPEDLRLGEQTIQFSLYTLLSAGSRFADVSRDGKRIIAISAEQPEATWTQVMNDWTSLIGKSGGSN